MRIFKKLICFQFKTQLILTYGLLFLLSIIVIQTCTSYSINQIFIKEYMNSDAIALEQVADKINITSGQIHDSFVEFFFDDDINSFFTAKDEFAGSLWDFSTSSYENHVLFNTVYRKIHTASNLNLNESVSLYLITPNGDAISSSSDKVEHLPELSREISQSFDNSEGRIVWKGPFANKALISALNRSLFLIGRLQDRKSRDDMGYIMVGIESDAFLELFKNYQQAQGNSSFAILSPEEGIMLSTDALADTLSVDFIEMIHEDSAPSCQLLSSEDGDYYVNLYPLKLTGWTMVHTISRTSITGKLSPVILNNWLIASIFLLVGLLFIYLISRLFTNRILRLKEKMDCAYEAEFKNPLPVEGRDEIAYLTHSYNDMIQMVQKYARQIIASQEQKRTAEFNFLQMQINTHFLYNVLNSIKVLARLNRNDEIRQTITALVRLLNATLSKQADIISVGQEFENVKNYFFLQKQMLQCNVTLHLDADPASLSCEVPKLILQPLVENSLLHGLYNSDEGLININAFTVKNGGQTRLHIAVEDNGTGIAPERFDDIWKKSRFNSIGLINVKERLELYYGESCSLSIQNRSTGGTRTDIALPIP